MTPQIAMTALDLQLVRLASHQRKRRIAAHAIDAMREVIAAAGLDVSHHPVDRIGNLVDELVTQAEDAGRVTRWTDTQRNLPLDAFEVAFEGRTSYAIALPTDRDGDNRPQTVVNLLEPDEYKRSAGGPRWMPRDKRGHSALAAALAPVVDRIAVVPMPAPSAAAPTIGPRQVASLQGIEGRSEDTGGAMITYETRDGRGGDFVCPWDEVPKRIAHLVERGDIDAESIALYRRVPFQVRTTVNVTIGG